jgi:hypothetical protein
MTFEEIFYCDIPASTHYPATKLKCYAYRCEDNTLFVNGYYEFFIDQAEYEDYYTKCQLNTRDKENIWVSDIYCVVVHEIEQQYHVAVEICDELGYWDVNYFPKFVFSYICDAYNDLQETS